MCLTSCSQTVLEYLQGWGARYLPQPCPLWVLPPYIQRIIMLILLSRVFGVHALLRSIPETLLSEQKHLQTNTARLQKKGLETSVWKWNTVSKRCVWMGAINSLWLMAVKKNICWRRGIYSPRTHGGILKYLHRREDDWGNTNLFNVQG